MLAIPAGRPYRPALPGSRFLRRGRQPLCGGGARGRRVDHHGRTAAELGTFRRPPGTRSRPRRALPAGSADSPRRGPHAPQVLAGNMPDARMFKGLAEADHRAGAGRRQSGVRWWGEMVNVLYVTEMSAARPARRAFRRSGARAVDRHLLLLPRWTSTTWRSTTEHLETSARASSPDSGRRLPLSQGSGYRAHCRHTGPEDRDWEVLPRT